MKKSTHAQKQKAANDIYAKTRALNEAIESAHEIGLDMEATVFCEVALYPFCPTVTVNVRQHIQFIDTNPEVKS